MVSPGFHVRILSSEKLDLNVEGLHTFWDLEKTMLHEVRVSGTVL